MTTQNSWLLHQCTEEDLDQFHKLDSKYEHKKDTLPGGLESLHCLDYDEEMILKAGGLQNLEFMFVPCHSVAHYLGEFYDEENFEACADPEETQEIPDYLTQTEALHQSFEALDARITTNEEVAGRVSTIEG